MIFAICGASGSGKSALIRELTARNPQLRKLVTSTTRHPRANETDGKEYFFVSRFDPADFVELDTFDGNVYGLSKSELNSVGVGQKCVCALTINGIRNLKLLHDDVVAIHLIAPEREQQILARSLKSHESVDQIVSRCNIIDAVDPRVVDHVLINHYGCFSDLIAEAEKIVLGT